MSKKIGLVRVLYNSSTTKMDNTSYTYGATTPLSLYTPFYLYLHKIISLTGRQRQTYRTNRDRQTIERQTDRHRKTDGKKQQICPPPFLMWLYLIANWLLASCGLLSKSEVSAYFLTNSYKKCTNIWITQFLHPISVILSCQAHRKTAGIRIRFWPRKRIRGSVPQTKGDFKKSIDWIF